MNKLAILVNVKDRPTELALLMQSLRTQTYQEFDLFILDDCSGTPLQNYHFFNCMITRMLLEGHRIYVKRSEFPLGVSRARQEIVDFARSINDYEFLARVDDDVILNSDYFELLFKVIDEGYDFASGVTPPMQNASFKRNPKHIKDYVNRVILNDEGEYVMNGDDCGIEYTKGVILPAHHFRSCALYKTKIHDSVSYYPTKLSLHGFREEQILSYKMLMAGFKIGVHTGALAWHQLTPSGGERFADQNTMVKFNQEILLEYTKDHKDKLNELFTKENMPSDLELKKETNLLMQ